MFLKDGVGKTMHKRSMSLLFIKSAVYCMLYKLRLRSVCASTMLLSWSMDSEHWCKCSKCSTRRVARIWSRERCRHQWEVMPTSRAFTPLAFPPQSPSSPLQHSSRNCDRDITSSALKISFWTTYRHHYLLGSPSRQSKIKAFPSLSCEEKRIKRDLFSMSRQRLRGNLLLVYQACH